MTGSNESDEAFHTLFRNACTKTMIVPGAALRSVFIEQVSDRTSVSTAESLQIGNTTTGHAGYLDFIEKDDVDNSVNKNIVDGKQIEGQPFGSLWSHQRKC